MAHRVGPDRWHLDCKAIGQRFSSANTAALNRTSVRPKNIHTPDPQTPSASKRFPELTTAEQSLTSDQPEASQKPRRLAAQH